MQSSANSRWERDGNNGDGLKPSILPLLSMALIPSENIADLRIKKEGKRKDLMC